MTKNPLNFTVLFKTQCAGLGLGTFKMMLLNFSLTCLNLVRNLYASSAGVSMFIFIKWNMPSGYFNISLLAIGP